MAPLAMEQIVDSLSQHQVSNWYIKLLNRASVASNPDRNLTMLSSNSGVADSDYQIQTACTHCSLSKVFISRENQNISL